MESESRQFTIRIRIRCAVLPTFLSLLWLQKLDFENPNERKFLLLVVATEEKTNRKLSSSATVTVEVEDLNDNHPVFDKESYTASIPEEAIPGKQFLVIFSLTLVYSKFTALQSCPSGKGDIQTHTFLAHLVSVIMS